MDDHSITKKVKRRIKKKKAYRKEEDDLESSKRSMRRKMIAERAYERYEARSRQNGNDWEDWFKAEKDLGI